MTVLKKYLKIRLSDQVKKIKKTNTGFKVLESKKHPAGLQRLTALEEFNPIIFTHATVFRFELPYNKIKNNEKMIMDLSLIGEAIAEYYQPVWITEKNISSFILPYTDNNFYLSKITEKKYVVYPKFFDSIYNRVEENIEKIPLYYLEYKTGENTEIIQWKFSFIIKPMQSSIYSESVKHNYRYFYGFKFKDKNREHWKFFPQSFYIGPEGIFILKEENILKFQLYEFRSASKTILINKEVSFIPITND